MEFRPVAAKWVTENLARGASPETIVNALTRQYGYSLPVARRLVNAASQNKPVLEPFANEHRPDIARDDRNVAVPRVETVPGWEAEVAIEMLEPHIIVFRNFIPQSLVADVNRQVDSLQVIVEKGAEKWLTSRYSRLPRLGPALECMKAGARALNWPLETWEEPYAHQYDPGMGFSLHYDNYVPSAPEHFARLERMNHIKRIGTLIIYLESAVEGGATYFANIGMRVCPRPGDAIFFGYDHDLVESSGTLHGGEVVKAGRKKILTLAPHASALPDAYQFEITRRLAAGGYITLDDDGKNAA